jgi:two-component system, OmpR family, sensor histidine kinase CiaH
MFNKLRMRLVLTNAIVAGLIVLVISTIAYVLIAGNIKKQSIQILQLISADIAMQANNGDVNTDMTTKIMGGLYPYFVVKVSDDGQTILSNFKTGISDDTLKGIVQTIIAAEKEKKQQFNKIANEADKKKRANGMMLGTAVIDVGNRSFRYSDVGGRNGVTYLVFLDMAEEKALLGNVLLSLAICFIASLALAFFGGLFLAGRALKPIGLSWQRQRDFVADASHELRSPLAAVRSSLDVVLARPEATVEEKREFLEGMGEELLRLSRLVDDMLLMARADSGAVEFIEENVNIAAMAECAINLMKPLAENKQIGCSITIEATPLVKGDAERLKQVMLILLDNAVKYTPEGGNVHVSVKYHLGKAIIEVSDTGIGIAQEHWQGIFERFYRVDMARNRESGGQGLGLSIAKWIVEKHNGSITIKSEPGKGSVFTITLPEGMAG